jgi:hypothetical protein
MVCSVSEVLREFFIFPYGNYDTKAIDMCRAESVNLAPIDLFYSGMEVKVN